MAAAILDTPPGDFMPANQRLIFSFETTTSVTDEYRYVVQVLEDGTEIGKYYLAPNAQEVAFFDLGEIAGKRVQVDQTPYQSTSVTLFAYDTTPFTRSRGNVKQYTVRVGEWNGSSETLNQDSHTFYLVGGREQLSAGLHPDFSDHYPTTSTRKGWLTDYSVTGSFIEMKATDEAEGRAALITRSTVSDATRIGFSVTTGSGTTTTFVDLNTSNGAQLPTATTPVGGFITYVPLMPATVNGIEGEDEAGDPQTVDLTGWISYSVGAYDGLTPKCRSIRVTRDCKTYKTTPVQIAWANSKGGWDYAHFEGKLLTTQQTQAKPYRAALGDWNGASFTAPGFLPETQYFHKEAEETYQLTGYFTQSELEVFKSLNLARRAFIKLDQWLPVLIEPNSYAVRTDNTQLALVTFNAKLAQSIRV